MKMNAILERQADGSYKMETDTPATAEFHQELPAKIETIGTVTMESPAFLDKLTNMNVAGVPVGAAVVGSGLAILVDRVALAKLDPTNKWGSWANLGAALVLKKWGGKLLGRQSADAAALILTYEAVADWVTAGMNKVLPPVVTAQQASMAQPRNTAVAQATQVANDYYASAFGG
jgi:hypothetical protein